MSFYVTTPIFYGNGEPHLGHAYSTMAADILARHMRQRGEDVFFLTGTDEHGEPIAQAAEREGISPKQLVDRSAGQFRDMVGKVDATNDFFIRTTDPGHIERVQRVVELVKDNGYVYRGTWTGWYCPRCADFKNESEIGPGDTCPIHEIPLQREEEENWFFKLSAFQEKLEEMYLENPGMIQPDFRRNEALSFIRGGLRDVSLSRSKLSWGVPLTWDADQVMYVWFDALLNYYTALGYAREGEDLTASFWPASWHILAKDILKFHAVYWPAFLMAAGLEPPQRMFIHGYLLMGEKKMSKSLGNVLDPFEVIERFGADALRYYCFREVSFGQDGSISTAGFEARYETELANDFGNLASRTLAMVDRYRDGVVPEAEPDDALGAEFEGLVNRVCALLDEAQIGQALEEIWVLVRRLNRYVEESQPWVLAKSPEDAGRLDQVLYGLVEGLRVITLLLHPYLPNSSLTLLEALGQTGLELEDFASALVAASSRGLTAFPEARFPGVGLFVRSEIVRRNHESEVAGSLSSHRSRHPDLTARIRTRRRSRRPGGRSALRACHRAFREGHHNRQQAQDQGRPRAEGPGRLLEGLPRQGEDQAEHSDQQGQRQGLRTDGCGRCLDHRDPLDRFRSSLPEEELSKVQNAYCD